MKFSSSFAVAAALLTTVNANGPRQGPRRRPSGYEGHGGHGGRGGHSKYVDSKSLQADISVDTLYERAEELQSFADESPEGNRVFGSASHNKSTAYLYNTFAELDDYYDVEYQHFVELYSEGNATLAVNGQSYNTSLFTYSPSGSVIAPLVSVANLGCNATDFSGVIGNVALISRGSCEFGLKSALAGAAGASGAIIYNSVEGELAGTLGTPGRPEGAYPPTSGVDLQTGQALLALIGAGTATADFDVYSLIENRTTQNVIAQSKQGDPNNVLVIGGHTDSVAAGPGINDNGSGSLGCLEVAVQLAKYKIKNAVRIILFSAEEFGLLGSEYYVKTLSAIERQKIRLYLNFDMIASPNYVYGIYDGDGSSFNLTGPPGSAQAEKTFEDYFRKNNIPFQGTEFSGRSDYGPFLDAGIPSGGLFTGAEVVKTPEEAVKYGGQAGVAYDANYHAAGDDIDNLNLEAWIVNTRAIADSVAKYAMSFDSIPLPTNRTISKRHSHGKRQSCFGHDHPVEVSR